MAPRKAPAPNYIQRNCWSHRYEIIEYDPNSIYNYWCQPTVTLPHRFTDHRLEYQRGWGKPVERRSDYPVQRGKTRPLPLNRGAAARHAETVRDAIAEGADLARSDVVLPWCAERGIPRTGPAAAPSIGQGKGREEVEEDEVVEDDVMVRERGAAHAASFSLDAIPRAAEGYVIRTREARRPRRSRERADDDWDVLSVASACDFVKI